MRIENEKLQYMFDTINVDKEKLYNSLRLMGKNI